MGMLQSLKATAMAGKQKPAAIGSIHMHPNVLSRGQIGDLDKRIDGAEVGRSRRRDHGDGYATFAGHSQQLGFKCGH